ncbi:MAG TPA: hypothetical protein GXX31_05475 [Methanothermobacter sp.]|jgi:hypothetical protein|uniref:Transposase n=1 Tax=Methanothermobacter tenebrarum TaxID=680118 RepID=A0ABM7YFQ0_9EURY|nr:hypothetical protein [Methanothermobacter tenebrarum]MDD3454568.1 hypothetical protein [Methanobacteriales archaeon]MDI6882827.1 hypothetical protein [Methanothermobacter sp.]MDX9693960.1 hypothetical protein [Methanothermobacter sp.]BDH80195.1 hypothetical protein MTTB_15740 [Methanothermobacter tenebrarum]HHW16805.1 hypothetical protein [Methanothermobacter sp.]
MYKLQAITLKENSYPPNKGKKEKMAQMLEIYHEARNRFPEQAEALNTTRTKLHFKAGGLNAQAATTNLTPTKSEH